MDLFALDGKVAVVTGGTRGIGAMIARGLLDAGVSRLYLSARKKEAVAAAERALARDGVSVVGIPADLSSVAECRRLAAEVRAGDERVHILVNNAGATWGEPFEDFPEAGWDRTVDLNLKGPFFLTQALLPSLAAAADADDPARVINIGSIDGLHVNPMPAFGYSASKAGLHHLTRHLARELGPRHVTVNAIAPGPFESKMMAFALDDPQLRAAVAARSPLGRIGRPADMAGAVVYLASRAGAYVTGAVIPVDGGIGTTA